MNIHWMLDIETLDTKPSAVITQIAAVPFNIYGEIAPPSPFYARISQLDDQMASGRTISASTVVWWLQANETARANLVDGTHSGWPLAHALSKMSEHMHDAGAPPIVWGNGATFDNVILSNAYDTYGIPRPWSYKADRCARTMLALAPGITLPRLGTHHDALDDARHQVALMTAKMRHVGLKTVD